MRPLMDALIRQGVPVGPWSIQTAVISGDGFAVVGVAQNTATGYFEAYRARFPSTCYANCDHSDVYPALNVNDFVCFINKFAAGDPYANCDGSTTPPILNANDFQRFLTAFSQGCP